MEKFLSALSVAWNEYLFESLYIRPNDSRKEVQEKIALYWVDEPFKRVSEFLRHAGSIESNWIRMAEIIARAEEISR